MKIDKGYEAPDNATIIYSVHEGKVKLVTADNRLIKDFGESYFKKLKQQIKEIIDRTLIKEGQIEIKVNEVEMEI